MTVTVLGISGSPHRHGNTETLLDSFLDGARNAGAEMDKIILRSMNYTPCRGCNACHKTGECIIQDDAEVIIERVMSCDCLCIASPIYSMGITAELKGLIDRAQYIWAQKFILKTRFYPDDLIRRHKGIFISTAGLPWEHVFDAAFPAITAFFNTLGIEYYDNIIANDMDTYKGIRGHPTALAEAFAKGEDVARVIGSLGKY
ncbi:MAG: flavodoxin family protein [Methanomicrobiales archaeon]|nr:flavodoxin family protein [Methanomicrobiales archaeon]